MKCTDIHLTPTFIEEYSAAPIRVQQAVDNIVRRVAITQQFSNGFNPHPARAFNNLWIGYVTRKGEHWRILFSFIAIHEAQFERLLPHDEMDRILRT